MEEENTETLKNNIFSSKFDKLLVLDLDETLVYRADGHKLQHLRYDLQVGTMFIYKRPGVDTFIKNCLDHFENVAVWTASSSKYAIPVIESLFPKGSLKFMFFENRCTIRRRCDEIYEYIAIKNLKKVKKRGFSLQKVLIVDDKPHTFSLNYGNGIHIIPWMGDNVHDKELDLLFQFLLRIGSAENVRTIEKRWWRQTLCTKEEI